MMHPRTYAGRSWSDAERRLLRFAAGPEQPKGPEDEVTKLRSELEAEKTKSRGYEQQLLEMRTRMDALEQTVRRVPSTLPALPDNVSPRVAVRGAVDYVMRRIDPAPAPGYGMRYERGVVYRARPGSSRSTWERLNTITQVRDDLRRERTARHTWIRDQRTKARFSPNLPMGGVSGDEYVGRTFDALDRRHEAGRPGFRSPSEGHFAAQALYASMRGDYTRVESNSSMYIDRTGKDRQHYAQFGGDPLEARDSYYGVGSGYYGPRGPGGGRSIAYPYGYDRYGKIDPADYGVRGGDVSWADRGGKDYASYNYPSRYAPAAPGADMQKYMRTQSRLRESYADDISWEFGDDLYNGKLDAELGSDPGYKSLKLAMMRAATQWKDNPSRRYGDLAIFRSQISEMRRRASQKNQQGSMIDRIKKAADDYAFVPTEEPSPSDMPRVEPEVPGVFKSYDLGPSSGAFFNRGEKITIVIPADVLGSQRDSTIYYDPGVWNGDLSDEQFAMLKRGGVAIERHESDIATYAQGSSRVPKVERLTVYFTKSGEFALNGAPVKIPLNPLYKGPRSPGRAKAMPPKQRGNVPGTYTPSAPQPNQPEEPNPGPSQQPERSEGTPKPSPEEAPGSVTDADIERWISSSERFSVPRSLGPLPKTVFERIQKAGGFPATVTRNEAGPMKITLQGKEWYLSSLEAKTKDPMDPKKEKTSTFVVIERDGDPSVTAVLPDDAEPTLSRLESLARSAVRNKESEEKDVAGMKTFEVAGKEKVGYVEVFDGTDSLTTKLHKGNVFMPAILSRRYDMAPVGSAIDFSKGDLNALPNRLQELYKAGARAFFVDVIAHGNMSGAGFSGRTITPEAFAILVNAFPDCKFTLNVVSCHGAGMDIMMRNFKDVAGAAPGRVTVITQTKLDTPNSASIIDENTATTAYNVALAKYLMQGYGSDKGEKLTYGQAHLLADRIAKRNARFDPEAMRSGMGKTAATDAPERGTRTV